MRTGEMMKNNLILKGLCVFLFLFAYQTSVQAAPAACKGPNKNDPGCGEETAPVVAAAVVDSVTVDWFNQALVVRGSGFTGSTDFLLGSSVIPLVKGIVTDTELDIPFAQPLEEIANEVTSQGNYNLEVDGAVQLSVYIESQIIDPAATGCPCEAEWISTSAFTWASAEADCYEITGTDPNDTSDISGTIHTDYPANSVHPQYPVGASFYPGDPDSSVCRLVEVNSDATFVDLVNHRINEIQQVECAEVLKLSVCTTLTTIP